MAFTDKKGISIAGGFKLQSQNPIDTRFTVTTKSDLDELVSLKAAYKGLMVYCDEDGITYKYNRDGVWVATDTGESSGLNEILAKYSPLEGSSSLTNIGTDVYFKNGTSEVTDKGNLIVSDTGRSTVMTITSDGNFHIVHNDTIDGDDSSYVLLNLSNEGTLSVNKIEASTIKGNASSASKLTSAVDIKIGESTKSFDGSTGLSYSLDKIGASPIRGNRNLEVVGRTLYLGDYKNVSEEELNTSANIIYESINSRTDIYLNPFNVDLNITDEEATPIFIINSSNNINPTNNDVSLFLLSNGTVVANKFRGEFSGNASSASKLNKVVNIALHGAVTGTATEFDGSEDISIPVTSIDGTKITGVIPLTSIPKSAQENVITVADKTEMFALTTETVQNGDAVRVLNDNGNIVMYFVADDTKLNSEDGYVSFSAGAAATVPVAGVEGLETWANEKYLRVDGGGTGSGGSDVTVTLDKVTFNDKLNIESTTDSISTSSDGSKLVISNTDTSNTNKELVVDGYKELTVNGTVSADAFDGNASSASKLNKVVNIALHGAVTGTATEFDGSEDITINTTAVNAANLYVNIGDVLILNGDAE